MKFCFIGNEDCNGRIIKAHILSQKATMLGLKRQNTKGEQVVIQLGSKKDSEKYPKEVGWSKASTYRCFCEYHDKILFDSIDNPVAKVDIATKDLFYHSLRTFAYSFYWNRYKFDQSGNALDFQTLSNEASLILKNGGIPGSLLHRNTSLITYHSFRELFIKAHLRKDYSDFDFCTISIELPQLISSANFFELPNLAPVDGPKFMMLNGNYGPYSPDEVIILTVVPEGVNNTRVIFCWKKSSVHSQYLMREIMKLGVESLVKFASRIICQGGNENSFINLGFWEFLESEYKSVIENLLNTEFQPSYSIPEGLIFQFLDAKNLVGNFDIFKVGFKYLNK